MVITSLDFGKPGKQQGFLQVPYSHNLGGWANLLLPVAVVSNGRGPTVLVLAGNHGDEYPGQVAVMRLRAELRLGDGPVVGVFGRLAAWKGQHILVRALAELDDTQALIVGDALFGEQPYRASLEGEIGRSSGRHRIHLTGFRPDIPALMQLCDVVVHTSIAPEPFGRVIVEAMLAGRPVIASAAGGAKEIVEDGRSGGSVAAPIARAFLDAYRAGRREEAIERYTRQTMAVHTLPGLEPRASLPTEERRPAGPRRDGRSFGNGPRFGDRRPREGGFGAPRFEGDRPARDSREGGHAHRAAGDARHDGPRRSFGQPAPRSDARGGFGGARFGERPAGRADSRPRREGRTFDRDR